MGMRKRAGNKSPANKKSKKKVDNFSAFGAAKAMTKRNREMERAAVDTVEKGERSDFIKNMKKGQGKKKPGMNFK